MVDEQFEFRSRHSTSLQLAHLVEGTSRNLGEKRLPGAGFIDVDKDFDNVWIDCLIYKLTLLYFPSHPTSGIGRSKRPSRRPRHTFEACGLGWLRVH
jgi:hypothetical protein